MQKAYKTDIKFMIGDMAYDSNDIYETLKEENDIISVVPYNPRNGKKIYDYGIQRLYFLDTSLLKQKYKRRTSVERVNNIVTKELGLDDLQYKGLKGVTFQAYIMHYSISSSFCCSVIGSPKTDATCFSLQVTFFTWNNTLQGIVLAWALLQTDSSVTIPLKITKVEQLLQWLHTIKDIKNSL